MMMVHLLASATRTWLLLFLGAAPELLGDASPAFAAPPHGAGGIAVPPSPRRLRAPRFMHCDLRASLPLSRPASTSVGPEGYGSPNVGTLIKQLTSLYPPSAPFLSSTSTLALLY